MKKRSEGRNGKVAKLEVQRILLLFFFLVRARANSAVTGEVVERGQWQTRR